MKNQRGCKINHTFVGEWSTRPHDVCAAAKARAYRCINDPAPKLTRLEHAFWVAARNRR